jgi:predicted oxidoreductase
MNLSKIIAGTMNWGVSDKNLSTKEMAHLIHLFVENGITTFDHADIYGGYTTEADFGKAFTASKIERSQMQFISKCGIQHTMPNRNNRVKHYDYSRDYIVNSVHQSLKNLETDYLDVLLLHRPSPLMVADEIAEAVEILKKEGKIKSFGLSNFTASQMALIAQKTEVSFNQIQFSLTHFDPMLNGDLDFMQMHKITPMAWSPLGSVFREDSEQSRRLKKVLAGMVEKYGMGSDLILLAWILKHPSGVLPVAGTVNSGRVQQLSKAIAFEMELEDWFDLWTESMGNKVP